MCLVNTYFPGSSGYTWSNSRAWSRIDYVAVPAEKLGRVCSCQVWYNTAVMIQASRSLVQKDHAPVYVRMQHRCWYEAANTGPSRPKWDRAKLRALALEESQQAVFADRLAVELEGERGEELRRCLHKCDLDGYWLALSGAVRGAAIGVVDADRGKEVERDGDSVEVEELKRQMAEERRRALQTVREASDPVEAAILGAEHEEKRRLQRKELYRLRVREFHKRQAELVRQVGEAERRGDYARVWRLAFMMGGTKRTCRRRRFGVPRLEQVRPEVWAGKMALAGSKGGCRAALVGRFDGEPDTEAMHALCQ